MWLVYWPTGRRLFGKNSNRVIQKTMASFEQCITIMPSRRDDTRDDRELVTYSLYLDNGCPTPPRRSHPCFVFLFSLLFMSRRQRKVQGVAFSSPFIIAFPGHFDPTWFPVLTRAPSPLQACVAQSRPLYETAPQCLERATVATLSQNRQAKKWSGVVSTFRCVFHLQKVNVN